MPTNDKTYMASYMKKYRTPEKYRENALRMRARREMVKEGRVREGDGKEVDHIRGVSNGNGKRNLRVISRKLNRRLGAIKANRGR